MPKKPAKINKDVHTYREIDKDIAKIDGWEARSKDSMGTLTNFREIRLKHTRECL